MAYLRAQGQDFADRHPKVAQRLGFSGEESTDPHTERLIESVAFLGARVHRELDREFPRIAGAILDNVCPTLSQPVPSITVVQMVLDDAQGKVTSGLLVGKGSMLQATAVDGQSCRFQTAWDTTLWPLTVSSARLVDSRNLRLTLDAAPGTDVSEIEVDTLRFHLAGDLMATMPLHEMLISALVDVVIEADGQEHHLGAAALREFGFDEGQEVLPVPAHAHPAYSLLQEYFVFPRKFQFFELTGLRQRLGHGTGFAVRLVFAHAAKALSAVDSETFRLGCVPVVNLFHATTEPIVMDRRDSEYRLVGDRQRESSTEVHSILAVIASDPLAARPEHIPNVYAASDSGQDGGGLYWTSRREAHTKRDISGTDTYLSFVDRTDVRQVPEQPVIYAEVLCTNRGLAAQLPRGSRLTGVGLSESLVIRVLYEPSAQRDPVMASAALWALASLLRLNHSSMVDGMEGGHRLREMLQLFAGDSPRDQSQIRGLVAVRSRPVTARTGDQSWRGHCRGTEVTLEFDPAEFAGSSPLLLAAVLARFLALYTTVNSFVRLCVERNGEPWMRWPPLSGRQCVI
jgi:type VI secretion system protein ImpG